MRILNNTIYCKILQKIKIWNKVEVEVPLSSYIIYYITDSYFLCGGCADIKGVQGLYYKYVQLHIYVNVFIYIKPDLNW